MKLKGKQFRPTIDLKYGDNNLTKIRVFENFFEKRYEEEVEEEEEESKFWKLVECSPQKLKKDEKPIIELINGNYVGFLNTLMRGDPNKKEEKIPS